MKFIVYIFLVFGFISCTDEQKEAEPVTDMNVATTFIKAIMKNDFDKAEKYMIHNADNTYWLNRYKQSMKTISKTDFDAMLNGDIIINESSYPTDSIFILNYSPSFNPKEKNDIKLIRQKDKWKVDFKYTFSKNS